MAAIADTLESLHKREIIHRDINLNIFLHQSQDGDSDYYTVLIDFELPNSPPSPCA